MLIGTQATMTKTSVIYQNFMIRLKTTMKTITLISNGSTAIVLLQHSHCSWFEEEFYDTCEFIDFEDQVDDLMNAMNAELVSDIYVHST
jgi:hypothetical protein